MVEPRDELRRSVRNRHRALHLPLRANTLERGRDPGEVTRPEDQHRNVEQDRQNRRNLELHATREPERRGEKDEGRVLAVLTRNCYGAIVLNTESVLFGDIDVIEPGFLSRILQVFGKTKKI